MLLNVLDATATAQKVIVKGQEAIVDHSSTITATGVSQQALAANAFRSGYFFQNLSARNMFINELGAATQIQGSILIPPGGSFPPDNYPVNTAAINIIGTISDGFTAREW
jgi:hypothetical protein